MKNFLISEKIRCIFAFILFILVLIFIYVFNLTSVAAATADGWAYDISQPSFAGVYDCSSSNCNTSLNAQVVNIDSQHYYYSSYDQTNLSANGSGYMWVYLPDTPLINTNIYSITTYICGETNYSSLVFKGMYSSNYLSNVYGKVQTGTVYYSQAINNLNTYPYGSQNGALYQCSYVNVVYKPNSNSSYVGLNVTTNANSYNYSSALIGYSMSLLGSANNLTSQDIQNIINNSGLATSSDINGLNQGISNIQSALSSAQNNINNNIDEAETNINDNTNRGIDSVNDNLRQESENIQNGIKDGFEECRDSYNLLDFSSPTNVIKSTFSFTNDVLTINSNGNYSGISYNILSLLQNNIGKTIRFDFDSFNSSLSLSDIEIVLLINGSYTYTAIVNRSGSSSNFVIPSSVENATSAVLFVYSNSSSQNIESSLTITKPIFHFGSSKIDYEPFGEKVCKNRIDTTNDKLDDLNNSLNNSDSSGATDDASSFFSGFTTNTFGLTSIITSPLNLINSLTSKTCTPLTLQIPYVNMTMQLPCMSTIYNEHFSTFMTIYQTITFGITSYWVCVRIFALVKDFKNPDHDEIEVMDL